MLTMPWRVRKFSGLAAAVLAVAGCDSLPRDPAGTLERVETSQTIRLGEVAGVPPSAAVEEVLRVLARRTGARITRVKGTGEELLEALEEGEIDLVYGHFADDSPWASAVHFGAPPGGPEKPPKSQRLPRFAFRMGENGWISTVEAARP